jgi:DNA-binding beta-propeller fold protein YncE
VNTALSPENAYAYVAAALDANDRLAVIDATSAIVSNWDRPPIDAINSLWITP